jgi:hypothetical protein
MPLDRDRDFAGGACGVSDADGLRGLGGGGGGNVGTTSVSSAGVLLRPRALGCLAASLGTGIRS